MPLPILKTASTNNGECGLLSCAPRDAYPSCSTAPSHLLPNYNIPVSLSSSLVLAVALCCQLYLTRTILYLLFGVSAIILVIAWRRLYPTPYQGIPYNEDSVKRIALDIPNLVPFIKSTNENSSSILAITTQNLDTQVAQLLFSGARKPLLILEDPRENEDILLRRNKEFDKAPSAIDLLFSMFLYGTVSQFTTRKLRA